MDDKLLEKMRKLLAMSKDSASENEAMIAAKRLHVLLSKHNLSLSDVEGHSDVDEFDTGITINPFKRIIADAIARLYYCKVYIKQFGRGANKSRIFVVGKKHHRDIANTIIKNVIKQISREARSESKLHNYGDVVSSFVTSFQNAAAVRIYQRCEELIEQAKQGNLYDEESQEYLPALLSVYENELSDVEDFFSDKSMSKMKTRSLTANSYSGAAAGTEAGNRANIHQNLKNTAPKMIGG